MHAIYLVEMIYRQWICDGMVTGTARDQNIYIHIYYYALVRSIV